MLVYDLFLSGAIFSEQNKNDEINGELFFCT
jgi:hypothetical protein